jgi:replicative superfamily II helicase
MQMPTGAGKTALSETLLFYHLTRHPEDAAILLVPYRSLAAELRGSLVKRLGRMGLPARCAYGGTVPTGDEVRGLEETRAIVATPEALSGLLSVDPDFFARVSLVICDEGHLLDGEARGVGLELLLARMRAREIGPPKFVFASAIVPNIEEINAWLGGTDETVVRSDYRPALAQSCRRERRRDSRVAASSASPRIHVLD